MWRNLKFLHMWSKFKLCYMKDVEKSENFSSSGKCVMRRRPPHVWNSCFLLLNLFYRNLCTFVANWFVAIYALLCGEKNLQKICVCGEKMTNIRYAPNISSTSSLLSLPQWSPTVATQQPASMSGTPTSSMCVIAAKSKCGRESKKLLKVAYMA